MKYIYVLLYPNWLAEVSIADGAGGKGTWGKLIDTDAEACLDRNDPNYDSGEVITIDGLDPFILSLCYKQLSVKCSISETIVDRLLFV